MTCGKWQMGVSCMRETKRWSQLPQIVFLSHAQDEIVNRDCFTQKILFKALQKQRWLFYITLAPEVRANLSLRSSQIRESKPLQTAGPAVWARMYPWCWTQVSPRQNSFCIRIMTENDYMPTKLMVAWGGSSWWHGCFTQWISEIARQVDFIVRGGNIAKQMSFVSYLSPGERGTLHDTEGSR